MKLSLIICACLFALACGKVQDSQIIDIDTAADLDDTALIDSAELTEGELAVENDVKTDGRELPDYDDRPAGTWTDVKGNGEAEAQLKRMAEITCKQIFNCEIDAAKNKRETVGGSLANCISAYTLSSFCSRWMNVAQVKLCNDCFELLTCKEAFEPINKCSNTCRDMCPK